MRRALAILPMLLLAACQPPAPPPLSGTGMDMFAPVKMRLHPLSRILIAPAIPPATTQPSAFVEARFEFTDQFGDVTKAPAAGTLEVFQTGPLNIKGAQLGTWNLDISTPQSNRDHYDRVTRTYVFKFALPPQAAASDRLLLVGNFTLPNQATLSDTLEVPTK